MIKSHESGLPFAYDRAGDRPEWKGLVFHGERPFLQSAELQDMQTIHRREMRQLGRLVAKDGDRIERAEAVVDREAGTVTLTAGVIYIEGSQLPVADAVLTDVPMIGRVEIGVRLVKSWITHEDDPDLLGPVPGSLAEGEPGAAREIWAIVWAKPDDGDPGSFYSVYTLQNGTILDQTGPSILEPALQALAAYDRPNGNYVVSGCRVTALGADAGAQLFSIEQGEANINGYKRTRYAALRVVEPEAWDEIAIPGETHVYPGGASHTFPVDEFPIGVINSILLTKEKTVTITRGAIANGADGLPDSSITQIVLVKQGGTTFVDGVDFIRNGSNVDWAPVGAEPAAGSTYEVTYRYRASVVADERTDKTITVSGGVAGGDIIVAYTRKPPRIDRVCLRDDGSAAYIRGVSARANPVAPLVPFDVLPLAIVSNDWMNQPTVVNDAVRSAPWSEVWRYFNRIVDHDRLIQLERLKNDIDAREPVAKKGTFVDPFIDDSYRDAGTAQTAALGLGMLQLAIEPTFHELDLDGAVMLDYVEDVIVSQELKTACEKINPYANFTLLPASMGLKPAVDFWTESRTEWLSSRTISINRGTTVNGPLQTRTVAEQLVDRRLEQVEFLREIPVNFEIRGFGPGEILTELTFDDIDVKPAEVIAADGTGKVSGSFVIPTKVTAGTKTVLAKGAGGKEASAMFTGQGTIETDVMRRVTTVNTWTRAAVTGVRGSTENGGGSRGGSDPQAQAFTPPEPRQIVGVDFHVCTIGNEANHLLVEQVSVDSGYPTQEIQAQAVVSMVGAAVGWTSARYGLPVTTPADRLSAFVIKSDDNLHSVSIAKLGRFDQDAQKYVAAHPYVVAPRFSSVNAATWTAHQDEALAFRLVAARYPVTTKVVDLGTVDLIDCSDIQIRASVELPSAACSVVFELERTNGTIYKLLPFQLLSLPEHLTETVEIRAVLTGTEKLSPILFAPVELVAGEILTEASYVTNAMALGADRRITAYLKNYLPGGATLSMAYSIDSGAWQELPLVDNEALNWPLWVERKFEETGLSGQFVRLKIEATGGADARLIAGDFGAAIF